MRCGGHRRTAVQHVARDAHSGRPVELPLAVTLLAVRLAHGAEVRAVGEAQLASARGCCRCRPHRATCRRTPQCSLRCFSAPMQLVTATAAVPPPPLPTVPVWQPCQQPPRSMGLISE